MATDATHIEETLSKRLSKQLDKNEISELAQLIASFADKGIEVDDVFPYGIQSQFDTISIRGYLTKDQLGDLSALVPMVTSIKDYRIFPRGIVAPDRYRMHMNIFR